MRCWRCGSSCWATACSRSGAASCIRGSRAIGVSAAATWFLRIVSTRVQRGFRDKVTIALESHVARLQASVATIAHQERPEYLDRLSVLRNQVFVLDHMYMSLFTTCGWILRLGVTVALLMSIHPALVLLAVCAIPTVAHVDLAAGRRAGRAGTRGPVRPPGATPTSNWPRRRRPAKRCGSRGSAAAWRPSAARPGRAGTARSRQPAGDRPVGTRWRGPSSASPMSSPSSLVSTLLKASAGDVLLVLAAGARLSAYVGATVGEIGFLRGIWMDGSRRLGWLEDYAASLVASADRPVPARLAQGIRFEHVSFAYPGTERLVLDDVNLELPAGSGRRHRRRERGRQDDARQTARQALRTDKRAAS